MCTICYRRWRGAIEENVTRINVCQRIGRKCSPNSEHLGEPVVRGVVATLWSVWWTDVWRRDTTVVGRRAIHNGDKSATTALVNCRPSPPGTSNLYDFTDFQ